MTSTTRYSLSKDAILRCKSNAYHSAAIGTGNNVSRRSIDPGYILSNGRHRSAIQDTSRVRDSPPVSRDHFRGFVIR